MHTYHALPQDLIHKLCILTISKAWEFIVCNHHCVKILFPLTNYNQKNFFKKDTFFVLTAINLLDTGQKMVYGLY